MIVYVSIGNSDDKLTQAEWARFCVRVREAFDYNRVHGAWFSAFFQNACWCVEITEPETERKIVTRPTWIAPSPVLLDRRPHEI